MDSRGKPRTAARGTGGEFFSPDGVHYLIEAGGEALRIKIADYEALTTEAVPGRFIGNDEVELSTSGGDFLIKSPRAGTVAINSFVYRIRKKNSMSIPGVDSDMVSRTAKSTGNMLGDLQRQIEGNLFLADLTHYSLMTKTLQKYSGGK